VSEFTFDASITVEAKTKEDAVDLILEHNMDADIPVALFTEGHITKKLQARVAELEAHQRDATNNELHVRVTELLKRNRELEAQIDAVRRIASHPPVDKAILAAITGDK